VALLTITTKHSNQKHSHTTSINPPSQIKIPPPPPTHISRMMLAKAPGLQHSPYNARLNAMSRLSTPCFRDMNAGKCPVMLSGMPFCTATSAWDHDATPS